MSMPDAAASLFMPFNDVSNLNNWIYACVQRYLKGVVLELGSGTGDLSSLFIEESAQIILTDPSKSARDKLRQRFRITPNLRYIDNIDLNRKDFQQTYTAIFGTIDTVVALNIVDNGFFTDTALLNANKLARAGGHIAFITPFKTTSYPGLNEDVEELKRQNFQQQRDLLKQCELIKAVYFTIDQAVKTSGLFTHAFLYIVRKLNSPDLYYKAH